MTKIVRAMLGVADRSRLVPISQLNTETPVDRRSFVGLGAIGAAVMTVAPASALGDLSKAPAPKPFFSPVPRRRPLAEAAPQAAPAPESEVAEIVERAVAEEEGLADMVYHTEVERQDIAELAHRAAHDVTAPAPRPDRVPPARVVEAPKASGRNVANFDSAPVARPNIARPSRQVARSDAATPSRQTARVGGGGGVGHRTLTMRNLHTGERLQATYWANGDYDREAVGALSRLMRDHRTGQVQRMDPRLLDLIHRIASMVDANEEVQLISGYRSPATNKLLRSQGRSVAKRSYHMKGQAADIRIPGRSLRSVRRAAVDLRGGGVGYYGSSNFLHVDLGPFRTWG